MAFYGYNGDVDDCNWTPYYSLNSSPTYSSYEYDLPNSMNYNSVYGQTETTTLIHYQHHDSFYPQTNFIINYSTLEFNEPDFEEYDDTPYGGGYDIALTYGRPLPPSDKICYPRSTPQPGTDGFSYGSISSPYGPKPPHIENGIKSADHENIKQDSDVKEDVGFEADPSIVVDEDLSFDDDKIIQSEGSDDQIPTYAYGSGLEAIDICDSIFGYWPCLEKRKLQFLPCNAMVYDEYQRDPWKSAADYLFGSGFVYEEEPRTMCHGHGYYFDGQHFDYSYD